MRDRPGCTGGAVALECDPAGTIQRRLRQRIDPVDGKSADRATGSAYLNEPRAIDDAGGWDYAMSPRFW